MIYTIGRNRRKLIDKIFKEAEPFGASFRRDPWGKGMQIRSIYQAYRSNDMLILRHRGGCRFAIVNHSRKHGEVWYEFESPVGETLRGGSISYAGEGGK